MQTTAEWKILGCTVKFLTPAFLGDANQQGRWRTPPFKALLRQWWRVAYVHGLGFQVDVSQLRVTEGKLFGNAWLEKPGKRGEMDFSQSRVRLRLERWDPGQLRDWAKLEATGVKHPEVTRVPRIDPHLYLGYGPLTVSGASTALARKPAINAGESARLELAFPDNETELIERTLGLIDSYATVGGRCRNGWGSFVLERSDGARWDLAALPMRDWQEALALDWPHAIGKDKSGPLIWQTAESFSSWRELMRALAIVRIGVRTQFIFPQSGPPHASPQPRHWLSYPITTHKCKPWDDKLRLPNSLRFKVRPDPNQPDKVVGVVFHMPCQPPSDFRPNLGQIQRVWQQVHGLLDELCKPANGREYASIQDKDRRSKLKALLNQVTLKRIPR